MPELDQQTILIIVAVVVVLLLVLIAVAVRRRKARNRRRTALRERFGPEYDRAVRDSGGERQAVEELSQREGRHERLELRGLDEGERDRVRGHMAALQYRFVEEPADTLLESQRVVTEVLREMGYPLVSDRAEGLRMLSVDHPLQTQAVRALLQGEYGDDVGDQRHLFLDVRMALRDIADISYELDDAARLLASPGEAITSGQDAAVAGPAISETTTSETTPSETDHDAWRPSAAEPAAPEPAGALRAGAGDGSTAVAPEEVPPPADGERRHEGNPT